MSVPCCVATEPRGAHAGLYCSFLLAIRTIVRANWVAQTDYFIFTAYPSLSFLLALLSSRHAQHAPERDAPRGTANRASQLQRDASKTAAFARALKSNSDQGKVVGAQVLSTKKYIICSVLGASLPPTVPCTRSDHVQPSPILRVCS